jgi:hypothetical protein
VSVVSEGALVKLPICSIIFCLRNLRVTIPPEQHNREFSNVLQGKFLDEHGKVARRKTTRRCPPLGVKWTRPLSAVAAANDPKRTRRQRMSTGAQARSWITRLTNDGQIRNIGLNFRAAMTRSMILSVYVVALIAVVVGVDVLFFRDRFWERLMVNVGIVLVFAAFYLRFLKHP